MVQLLVKLGGDGDTEEEFLFDCQITSSIEEIADAVIEIANFQSEIQSITFHLEPRLSPLLHTDLQRKVMPLMKALSEAEAYVSKDQVQHNKPLSVYVLRDQTPISSNTVQVIWKCEKIFIQEAHVRFSGLEHLDEGTTQLWWAGKELTRGKKLCDYIGKNERTKELLEDAVYLGGENCVTIETAFNHSNGHLYSPRDLQLVPWTAIREQKAVFIIRKEKYGAPTIAFVVPRLSGLGFSRSALVSADLSGMCPNVLKRQTVKLPLLVRTFDSLDPLELLEIEDEGDPDEEDTNLVAEKRLIAPENDLL
ncbi:hypothetical protein RJ639_012912 [Escallonia herrerae]|uniref:Uncharacterized protein n=1 Tax=Escallonia herrerae TaxID=1293975 RepID=A0AA88VMH1_9ASTE|nr:hypothetical protein RJ639_012912 [Escallonia herrerae]